MTHNGDMPEIPVDTLAETQNYVVWSAVEPDGERTFHLELGPVTAHFFQEEWTEFVRLLRQAGPNPASDEDEDEDDPDVAVELDWGALHFSQDEWHELLRLLDQIG